MHRNLLAAVLALSFCIPFSAQSSGIDPFVTCTVGRAVGEWDLPVGDQPGSVRGFLVDMNGRKLGLEGTLTTTLVTEDGILRGRLEGTLHALKNDDRFHHKALAVVVGTWVAGPLGRGRFHAEILEIGKNNGNQNASVAAGKLAGEFADPQTEALLPLPTGFTGRWMICL